MIEEKSGQSDKGREGITLYKLKQIIRLFKKENRQVLLDLDKFTDLDLSEINKKYQKNYQGLILDFDETLSPLGGKILPENEEKIAELLKENFKIVIFSNMRVSDRYDSLLKKGVKLITSKYAKPDPRGFQECLKVLNLSPKEVVMIGDNLVTDGGSMAAGIDFIRIKPIFTPGLWKHPLVLMRNLMRDFFNCL